MIDGAERRLALAVGDMPPRWMPLSAGLAADALVEGRSGVGYGTVQISESAIRKAMGRIEEQGLSGNERVLVEVEVKGDLEPGNYEGKVSLSD